MDASSGPNDETSDGYLGGTDPERLLADDAPLAVNLGRGVKAIASRNRRLERTPLKDWSLKLIAQVVLGLSLSVFADGQTSPSQRQS